MSGKNIEVSDVPAVQNARQKAIDYDGCIALGQALSRQLRYREAISAYSDALFYSSNDCAALRLRAGLYLSTLQPLLALKDFQRCLDLGADIVDCCYRMGLAYYYAGKFEDAMTKFQQCIPLCNDEMGIAVIYWHTICTQRAGKELTLLEQYRPDMIVGHHIAYEKAMRVWVGRTTPEQLLEEAEYELDDIDDSILLYGILYHPSITADTSAEILNKILRRDGFWPCYAFLAAWNDIHQTTGQSVIEAHS